jgi:hypothetical protein
VADIVEVKIFGAGKTGKYFGTVEYDTELYARIMI